MKYQGVTATQCANLVLVKIHLNSTISTKKSIYATLDIKDYYYGMPLDLFEYAQISLYLVPEEIIVQYNLFKISFNGWVYLEIRKVIPGLTRRRR